MEKVKLQCGSLQYIFEGEFWSLDEDRYFSELIIEDDNFGRIWEWID